MHIILINAEYGLGVKPSIAGDAYSFGVLLLELFTGKSPIDDSLMGEQTLVEWVQSACPAKLLQRMRDHNSWGWTILHCRLS